MPHTHAQLQFLLSPHAQLILPSIIHANYVSSLTIGAQLQTHASLFIVVLAKVLFPNISIAHSHNTQLASHAQQSIFGALILETPSVFMTTGTTAMDSPQTRMPIATSQSITSTNAHSLPAQQTQPGLLTPFHRPPTHRA